MSLLGDWTTGTVPVCARFYYKDCKGLFFKTKMTGEGTQRRLIKITAVFFAVAVASVNSSWKTQQKPTQSKEPECCPAVTNCFLSQGKDVVSSLLFGTLHILILTGFCFFLAIVVPLVALGILLSRYACGLCGGGEPSGEPENADDTNTRQKWSAVFYIITTLMTFMLICAFYTKDHLPVAAQGAKDQAYFLVNTIPLIFDKLREDFDVLVGENLDKFQNTAARRSVDCRKETATAVDSMFQPGTVPEFFSSTAERTKILS
ncbi:hypothetical protein V5799_007981 [Amblyomma americanum]|uniref:Uncharacterized protein n=1 Tax=Amblyomma americanum TaxID=6943 RepID=A0AAQ4FEE0_AMBAM